ncbi:CehA/McbA family metallohydrolase [Chelativorans salis]|uniref:CehA/McbA family metallohydrolase n=1 Tax=Chelativorans salis TaxID=2978478 RepID=A0ABT2LUJ9_9HYPH|nr:CehA/McbA family metallohydrolase [Chelativorans sp. EGI FJ00035]MCT7378203.1 CehA/McbA family metallohydrolase [Chelativorans sp. EGI FJ00035]
MESQEHHFSHTVTDFPGGEKSFVEIPFHVGPEIERIEVSYLFPAGSGGSVIDLGIAHEGRMRGWTGSEYGHITIAADRATPGYHPGPLAGRWDVVLGIVKIGPDCRVDVTIRLIPRSTRWLTGDIHSHTEHSDGGVPVGDAIHRARTARLDFVALTDHNTTAQNRVRPDDPGMLVIPGMELTSYWGHTNFLGVADPVEDWRCRRPEDVAERMAEARANGATIVINHPFQRSAGGKWQCGLDLDFDAIEIWNGPWSPLNADALRFWQELLTAGRIVPATGGSDFHLKNRRRHGRPSNRLLACGEAVADVLEAIRAGRNVVCFGPETTTAEPLDRTAAFGERVPAGAPYAVRFSGLAAGDEVRVVTEKGTVDATRVEPGQTEIIKEGRVDGRFARFEVWHGEEPRLFTNPFYAA